MEYVNILRGKQSCWHVVRVQNIEIENHAKQEQVEKQQPCQNGWQLELNEINKNRKDDPNLHFASSEPSPIVAALICYHVSWPNVDGHGKDTPPVVLAATESHLVRIPPLTRIKVWTYQPACEEHEVIRRRQSDESLGVDFCVVCQRKWWRRSFILPNVSSDLQVAEECAEHEEFFEAHVRWVDQGVSDCLKVVLKGPRIVCRTAHRKLGSSESQDPN